MPASERKAEIAVAMSGGLDSSVAAALLTEAGHRCVGIMMRLWSEHGPGAAGTNKCCSAESVDVAREVADRLDMPFYLINVEETFKQAVVDPFVADYMAGLTPNPCLNCNRHIRFTYLLEYAARLGLSRLATGHHARTRRLADGSVQLLRACDPGKDQSYVLSVLDQTRLRRVLFPAGEYLKSELRNMARDRRLPVADKDESMDLCFVADNDYRRFLVDWGPDHDTAGPVRTADGTELGQHAGLFRYTIGQRRGLNISNPTGYPLYVIDKIPESNMLVVGPLEELAALRERVNVTDLKWIQGSPPDPEEPLTCQIRYNGTSHPCAVEWDGEDRARVTLGGDAGGVAPGQAAVFYSGAVCLGGGLIGT